MADATGLWRGQLSASGWYLHGTWDDGEYSFSLLPFVDDPQDVPAPSENLAIFSIDPYQTEALTYQHPDGTGLTVHRNQDRIARVDSVIPTGEKYSTWVDDRLRPVRIEGPGWLEVTLEWSEDGTSVAYTVDEGGATLTGVLNVDLSDSAALERLTDWEVATGQDLTNAREWVLANPGQLAAIYSGQAPAPDILGEMVAQSVL